MTYRWILVCVTSCLLIVTAQHGFAQSAALGLPGLVVTDADGKAVAQVIDLEGLFPRVVLDIDGIPAFFVVDLSVGQLWRGDEDETVYFSEFGCGGDAYIAKWGLRPVESSTRTAFIIAGPDSSTGTYRVFRSNRTDQDILVLPSKWDYDLNTCNNVLSEVSVVLAEEVIPNPMEGYHGPTNVEPERVWTLAGGDIPNPGP